MHFYHGRRSIGMRRFEQTPEGDAHLDRVFSYLRGKKQGFKIKVKDDHGEVRTVLFVRRGQDNVSVIDPETNKSDLISLDRVIVE
jgi:hypothetical protein